MLRKICITVGNLFKLVAICIPGGLRGKIKIFLLQNKLKKWGRNVVIDGGVIIGNL